MQRKKGVGSEKQSVLLCSPVSDKETINGVALAKGIKSTHAWLLFKLIKGSFFWEARFTTTTKPAEKEAGNSSGDFA